MGLTTDPSRYLPTSQEPNYIRCKVITVEFDQVVRIRMVHVLKREEVFVECILINLGSSAIDDLDGLAMVGFTGDGFEDTLAKEDLSAKDYY
jgi:hypothetical protein